MNRRQMLQAMLGTAAVTALPSEIWPFRKIFLPTQPKIQPMVFSDIVDSVSDISYYYELGVVKDVTITYWSSAEREAWCVPRTEKLKLIEGPHVQKLNLGEGKAYFRPYRKAVPILTR